MKQRTNFDVYLEELLKDPDFAGRFKKAGETWDVAVQLSGSVLHTKTHECAKGKAHVRLIVF